MIKELVLDDTIIKYQISYKKNKNTYFYFKRNGYIQINASRNQKPEKIFDYIHKNKEAFIKKYKLSNQFTYDNNLFYYFGKEYIKVKDIKTKDILVSHCDFKVYEPVMEVDQLDKAYKKMNKKVLLKELHLLKNKYKDNLFVDINNISLKTRYMNTRFGSCNPKLRTININLYLVHYNIEYLEYVFLHEITHLVHHNHSKEYYALLKKLSPNYAELKKELNNKFIQR